MPFMILSRALWSSWAQACVSISLMTENSPHSASVTRITGSELRLSRLTPCPRVKTSPLLPGNMSGTFRAWDKGRISETFRREQSKTNQDSEQNPTRKLKNKEFQRGGRFTSAELVIQRKDRIKRFFTCKFWKK